jgi:hypothetical protein
MYVTSTDESEKQDARTRRVQTAANDILRALQIPASALARPQHMLPEHYVPQDVPSPAVPADNTPAPVVDLTLPPAIPVCPSAAAGVGACGDCPVCNTHDP